MREMKGSGVPWIGEIPSDWTTIKVKAIATLINGYAFNSQDLQVDRPYRVVRIGDLVGGAIDFNNCLGVESTDGYEDYRLLEGDVLIALSGATVGKTAIVEKAQDAYINQRVGIVRSNLGRLIYYIFMITQFVSDLKSKLNDSAQPNMSLNDIGQIMIPFCNQKEATLLIRYLDKKCTQIDSIIAKEQAVIDKLQEYKRSVITEAVTKGLNPDVAMKESGVEWLEYIPSQWDVRKLVFASYIRARLGWKGLKAEEYLEAGHPFLSAVNIQNDKLIWDDINFISDDRYEESPEIKLQVGDILLVKDGAGIGKCAVVNDLPYGTAAPNSSLGVITPNSDLNTWFLYYFFESSIFQNSIARIKNGMGVPHLTQGYLKNIMVVIPPYEEQEKIVAYLDSKCAAIDNTIERKQSLVTKLTEYKQSLIYEVVTGKKEVPHV